jgi:hypothetical protein
MSPNETAETRAALARMRRDFSGDAVMNIFPAPTQSRLEQARPAAITFV